MKKKFFVIAVLSALLFIFSNANANTIEQLGAGDYQTPIGFGTVESYPEINLDHQFYYNWYLNDIENYGEINQIDIVFHNIYNYNNEENYLNLYIKDYEGTQLGWQTSGIDWQSQTNPNWTALGYESLGTWSYLSDPEDLYLTRYDVVFSITDSSIISMMTNGTGFNLGIDPDCHYWGDEIEINAPVPEPTTLLLFGTGLIGIAGIGRNKIFNMKK